MRKRDGLLLAPIVLVGAMMASFAVSSRPLAEPLLWTITGLSALAIGAYLLIARREAEPLNRKACASRPETATDEDERRPKDGRDVT
ncbi:MAG: hypothetical protein JHD15_03330 [Phenylobacterium sp.]|uniref:hypothetical protein n=1 Tax=Phenylobacterium sp. TaxID=1871053 RepID=UPI001A1B1068|nr:hypothetical protein [Phenylobacterium sp.]MBJ7409383.1 hypothetical protein [Phenylobacterium sp.]